MPLASSGALSSIWREAVASARNIPHNRAYHLNAPSRSSQTGSIGQRLLRQTRGVVQAFVGHLTTPGTLGRASPAHSLHHLTRGRTIESGLSLHVRNALAQPLSAPKLPRPPTVPRNVFQVGLGSARKFSTGRPIFAHLAENVPVTGRALAEADFDLRLHEEKRRFMKENLKEAEKKEKHIIRVEKLAAPVVSEPEQADAPIEASASELERYFPAPAAPKTAPGVTTTLLVPLAPSPSSRLPLPTTPKNSSDSHPIVPFAEMSALHYDFTRHNDRVAALFLRLDGADVWSQGARCDAYGDTRGGANVLRVAFDGWDAKRVRAIIGETGSGWCVLEEDRELDDDELDEALAALEATEGPLSPLPGSRPDSPISPPPVSTRLDAHPALADFGVAIDPSQSFVLPTLDFSSSFAGSTSGYATDFAESELEDGFSDPELLSDDGSDGSWNEVPSVVGGGVPSGSWLGFSSAFEARMNDGPMEEMF